MLTIDNSPENLDPLDASLLACSSYIASARATAAALPIDLEQKRRSFEGVASLAGTLAGTLYMATAHSISGAMAWVLFLVGIASFVLSIFAAGKQSRWWFILTVFAFTLILVIASSTEGCTTDPCPL